MAESILQAEKECWFCGARAGLESHHIFAGVANRPISEKYGLKNRPISEKYGLKVWLCHRHHTGDGGAQYDPEKSLQLKQEAQKAFERIHGHELWMKTIRKNYL